MQRKNSPHAFPSTSLFSYEPPNKRARHNIPEETHQAAPNEAEEEVWDDLDDAAVEECMVLATQMCSQAPPNTSEKATSSTFLERSTIDDSGLPSTSHSNSSKFTFHKKQNGNFKRPDIQQIPDAKKNLSQQKSLSVANRFSDFRAPGTQQVPDVKKNLSVVNRFNDFKASADNTVVKSQEVKPNYGPSRAYNTIPMKGNSNQDRNKLNSTSTNGDPGSDSEVKRLLKIANEECERLKEELSLKQGEVNLLRAEFKRKESQLETERLDRYADLELAEKKGKEKASRMMKESETKIIELDRNAERLQGELHFKNQEVQELMTRIQRLEQNQGERSASSRSNIVSPGRSPGKSVSSFASRFDFGKSAPSVQHAQVQTEGKVPEVKNERVCMQVSNNGGVPCGNRRALYIMSGWESTTGTAPSASDQDAARQHLCLDPNLSSTLAHMLTNTRLGSNWVPPVSQDELDEKLYNTAIMQLKKMTHEEQESSSTSTSKEYHESKVESALRVLSVLAEKPYFGMDPLILHIIGSHLKYARKQDLADNQKLHLHILETLSKVAPCVTEPERLDSVVSQLCEIVTEFEHPEEALQILETLKALACHQTFIQQLCSSSDNCFTQKLCIFLDKFVYLKNKEASRKVFQEGLSSSSQSLPQITKAFVLWTGSLLQKPPNWIMSSNCHCPSDLLVALLKLVYVTLTTNINSNAELVNSKQFVSESVWLIIKLTVGILHNWCLQDENWGDKVAAIPYYTTLMHTIGQQGSHYKLDKLTVDMLCDLWHFEEGTFLPT
ncbi:uncharacterized protein LOC143018550 isoform X2 [Oratosquilla oratoria]